MIFFCRILAFRYGMVQRLRHLRRARLFGEHNAHVLHLPRTISRHKESSPDPSHIDETNGGLQDRCRMVAGHARLELDNGIRYKKIHIAYTVFDTRTSRRAPRPDILRLSGSSAQMIDASLRYVI